MNTTKLFESYDECLEFVHRNIPNAVIPAKRKKNAVVYPFITESARKQVVNELAYSLYKKVKYKKSELDNLTLFLTIKGEFFDMIASGFKMEEYREIKPYWTKKIESKEGEKAFRPIKFLRLRNGYTRNAREIFIICTGIRIGIPRPEWSGGQIPQKPVYIFSLGSIITIK